MLAQLKSLFSNKFGIDPGTANSLVHIRDRGIALRVPSVVAIQAGTSNVLAVGKEAKRMLGQTPGKTVAIRPVKDGVIANFEITEAKRRHFVQQGHHRNLIAPPVAMAVPSGIPEVENQAVKDSATHAGAREVYLTKQPMASATGVGLPVHEPAVNRIVDIGSGTREIAIISLTGIVFSRSLRVGGDGFDETIVAHMKQAYNLMIGERTAEEIKLTIDSAFSAGAGINYGSKGPRFERGVAKNPDHSLGRNSRSPARAAIEHFGVGPHHPETLSPGILCRYGGPGDRHGGRRRRGYRPGSCRNFSFSSASPILPRS